MKFWVMALTRRQREVLDFIRSFVATHHYSPSLEEIAGHFGLSSVATVHKHVQHLVEKGHLRKAWNRARSVEPIESGGEGSVVLPLLGSVAAGRPIEAVETDETLEVPRSLLPRGGDCFALRVSGDSMVEDHIADGDFVIVESRPQATDGEAVVALLRGEEVTLKRFYRRGSRVRLEPANSEMRAFEVPAEDVEIRGVVRGLLRKF
ncbi:MAG: transcriptional repressor LexA [Myxococcota bacterium]